MTNETRTRHQVKDDRDITKLLKSNQISEGDIIEFDSGLRRLVIMNSQDAISVINKGSGSNESIEKSCYGLDQLGGMFLGRYYPGKKETVRGSLLPSDDFDKYKELLQEVGLWK